MVRPPGQPHTNPALRSRTRLDESGVNIHGLNSRITLYKGLRVFMPGDNTAHFLLQLYFVYSNIDFPHVYFFFTKVPLSRRRTPCYARPGYGTTETQAQT